eukprot:TRINITY_DN16005_c0_g1_i2.p1 TRINITY_DN16005_c0_g1~~TRINITY_DN16005_c0_g1_i2.p1  ORF type:complete len:366 (-),score=23.81 TRINITY_DN16005_c0_g1_i2:302-1399(-)
MAFASIHANAHTHTNATTNTPQGGTPTPKSSSIAVLQPSHHAPACCQLQMRSGLASHLGLQPRGDFNESWVVANFAQEYLASMQRRITIYFQHISKAGGTHLCVSGWSNQCVVHGEPFSEGLNCKVLELGDMQDWMADRARHSESDERTCESFETYALRRHITLRGPENYVIPGAPCPLQWNVVVVREPITRILSHMNQKILMRKEFTPEHYSGEWLFNHTRPVFCDNFLIRSLLGFEVYRLGFGSISPSHIALAKQVLLKFDVVIPQLQMDLWMKLALGWTCTKRVRVSKTDGRRDALLSFWNRTGVLQKVEQLNQPDIRLFDATKKLLEADLRIFQHPSFRSVVKAQNYTACTKCGFLQRSYP